ncbi:Flp pilus assembly protein TadB [Streptacidiphilus sp. MAP12-20]|uniref:type II secretion system F family protein n=1 Tax=Streptacidiphilus sp. MAP12-20 TaxID=3156299 RepID=UPI00351667CF
MSLLLWATCGAVLLGGVVALIAFGRGSEQRPPEVQRPAFVADSEVRRRQLLVGLSVAGAALVWLLTGYLVALVIVPLLVFGVPWLVSATTSSTAGIDRLEALSEWTQRLSDVLLLGVGLEQAIIGSLKTVPAALEADVTDLVGRIRARMQPEEALRVFADRLGDATSDKVMAALLLRVNDRGPGLARALADMADSVRAEVRQRRVIEADRAKHRATVRWMVLIILAVIAAGALNTEYISPYRTLVGQVVVLVCAMGFFGVVSWMGRMARYRPVPRFLEYDRRTKVGRAQAPDEEGGPA